MHQEDYKGRRIAVDTYKRGRGWTWSYQIDGGPVRLGKDRPLTSEGLMRGQAIGAAKAEIDGMP